MKGGPPTSFTTEEPLAPCTGSMSASGEVVAGQPASAACSQAPWAPGDLGLHLVVLAGR